MNKFEAVEKVNGLFEYEFDKEQYNAADYWRVLDVTQEKDAQAAVAAALEMQYEMTAAYHCGKF